MTLFIIGEPLAGKSTLATEIGIRLNIPNFSTGDFARSLGMRREASIEKHDLSLEFDKAIRDEVQKQIHENDHVIIEGFPRSAEQFEDAEIWTESKAHYLFLRVNQDVALSRLNDRQRSDTDTMKVWLGRYEASGRLLRTMRQVIGYTRASVYWQDVEDDDWLIRDVKGLMYGQKNCW